MTNKSENNKFDISRREGIQFRHYQLMVKLMRDERTEHCNLEVFTTGPHQLLEMRRIYTSFYSSTDYSTLQKLSKNN